MNLTQTHPPALGIRPRKKILPNGLTVVSVEMPHLHTIELSIMVRAGLRMETEATNGISHFLEHMLFRGNRHFENSIALSREFETIGRDLRAATHSEYTSFGFSPHPPNLERAMQLLALFFDGPTFPGLELERGIILEECLEDLNDEGANININNLACQLLYAGNPLSWPTIGTEQTIRAITEADLKHYFETWYHPSNMVLAGAGAIDGDRFESLAEQYFGGWSHKGRLIAKEGFGLVEKQDAPRTLFQQDKDSQIQLQLCFRSRSYNHPDYFALSLISRMFDDGVCSRLQKSLREDRGLVYSVECRATSWSDTGTFDFDVQVSPENAGQVTQILFEEIKTFLRDGPSQAELDHVKNRYEFDLELDLDDPYKQIDRYAFPELFSSPMPVEEERERMRAVTLEECRRVAEETLAREKLNVIAVGPVTGALKQEVQKQIDGF